MTSNWTMPLDEIVKMATPWFTERGRYFSDQAGVQLAQQFYMGRDRAYAGRKIQKALEKSISEVNYQKWLTRTGEFIRMEKQLEAEGWVWCDDISIKGAGVWWYKPLNLSVNRMGGTFPTREEATLRTYNSGLRQTINSGS